MASLPLALIGVMLALLVTRTTLNLFSMIGLVMLMGLVTKNAILLVDFANHGRRPAARAEALLQAGLVRMRPILMTTAAMVFGMLPLALALNEGGEIQAPMGRAIIGGVITSTLLTLVVVPVLYSYLTRERKVAAVSGAEPAHRMGFAPAESAMSVCRRRRHSISTAGLHHIDTGLHKEPSCPMGASSWVESAGWRRPNSTGSRTNTPRCIAEASRIRASRPTSSRTTERGRGRGGAACRHRRSRGPGLRIGHWELAAPPGGAVPAAQRTCADVSARSLEISRSRFPDVPARHVEITGSALPFEDESFDLIVSACVFHHIDACGASRLARRVAAGRRRDGMLLISSTTR
jgi:hypothetical protein